MCEYLSSLLGILGLIASLVGTYLTWISFVNPMQRFKKYLKKSNNWEQFQGIENHLSIYRHKKHPNFQIIIDWDRPVVQGFTEDWMRNNLTQDQSNNASYFVRLEANSTLLAKELFVSFDGARNFVPVPRQSHQENGERRYFYGEQQIKLANIIGRYDLEEDIDGFAVRHNIELAPK